MTAVSVCIDFNISMPIAIERIWPTLCALIPHHIYMH